MTRISMKNSGENRTVREIFERFLTASLAKGVSERTVKTYRAHFGSVSHHLDMDTSFCRPDNDAINNMIVSMRQSGLAHNSISSYTRVMRTFFKLRYRFISSTAESGAII